MALALWRRFSGGHVAVSIIFTWVSAVAAIPPGMTEEERLAHGADEPTQAVAAVAGPGNVTVMGQVMPQQFSTNSNCVVNSTNVCANDVWSYVSPSGREYGILGLRNGTGFVDVTDPYSPFVVGAITDANSVWSDMKTYSHYAYNVNESGGGMQIIDLALIDPPTRQVTLVGALTQNNLQRSHTLWINEASGFAYLSGSNLGGGRLVAVDLANPASPTIAGQMVEGVYVHAAQIVTYTTGAYAGQEIAFCYCGSQGLKIVNVTNKASMSTMATVGYPTLAYCHQGELTTDQRYVVIDDELDESQGLVATTTTYVVDVQNLSAPFLETSFTNGLPVIDHNQMVRGNFTYQANYTSGLRIRDITDVNDTAEVGAYDTYPLNNSRTFNGAWGVTTKLPSGAVLLSDMHAGLFIFDVSEAVGTFGTAPQEPQAGPAYVAKNRYLTIEPGEPGEYTALRLTVTAMPPAFASAVGSQYWVDRPVEVVDNTSPPQTHWVSRLRCTPIYFDFGSIDTLQIADEAIVPGGGYSIEAIRTLSARSNAAHYSAATSVPASTVWGDVAGTSGEPPDGALDAIDIASLVNKFKQLPGAPGLPLADLHPGHPNQSIDALDIAVAVDAYKQFPYPFAGPTPCP